MLRLFDVGNKNHTGLFVVARDEEHAKDIAMQVHHAKARTNLHVHDITDASLAEDKEIVKV